MNAPKSEAITYGKRGVRTQLASTLTTTLTTSYSWNSEVKYAGIAVDKNYVFKLYWRRRTEEHTPVFDFLDVPQRQQISTDVSGKPVCPILKAQDSPGYR